MGRVEQLNELLHQNLAEIVNQEINLENGLITVCRVDCSPDLENSKIYISVLPDNLAGTALERLRNHSGAIARILAKKIRMKKVPRLKWVFDPTEKKAADIEKLLEDIKEEDNG